jgi:hypothetical protein
MPSFLLKIFFFKIITERIFTAPVSLHTLSARQRQWEFLNFWGSQAVSLHSPQINTQSEADGSSFTGGTSKTVRLTPDAPQSSQLEPDLLVSSFPKDAIRSILLL